MSRQRRRFDTTKINHPEVVDGCKRRGVRSVTRIRRHPCPVIGLFCEGWHAERNAKTVGFHSAFILFYIRNLLYCFVVGVTGQMKTTHQQENSKYYQWEMVDMRQLRRSVFGTCAFWSTDCINHIGTRVSGNKVYTEIFLVDILK